MPFKRRVKDKYAGSLRKCICCPNYVRFDAFVRPTFCLSVRHTRIEFPPSHPLTTFLILASRIVHITGELILQMEELDSFLATSASSLLAKLDLDSDPKTDAPSDRMIATLRQSWKTRNHKVND